MIWREEKDYIYYKYILIDIPYKYILINQLSYKNSTLICIRIWKEFKIRTVIQLNLDGYKHTSENNIFKCLT